MFLHTQELKEKNIKNTKQTSFFPYKTEFVCTSTTTLNIIRINSSIESTLCFIFFSLKNIKKNQKMLKFITCGSFVMQIFHYTTKKMNGF